MQAWAISAIEACPSMVQLAPAPRAAALQFIDQGNFSVAPPGIFAVIQPDHRPTTAPTVRFTSGGGGGGEGALPGFSCPAKTGIEHSRKIGVRILFFMVASSGCPDARYDPESAPLRVRVPQVGILRRGRTSVL